jgi:hypothetical protein
MRNFTYYIREHSEVVALEGKIAKTCKERKGHWQSGETIMGKSNPDNMDELDAGSGRVRGMYLITLFCPGAP